MALQNNHILKPCWKNAKKMSEAFCVTNRILIENATLNDLMTLSVLI